MINTESFKAWIRDNTEFSDAVVCDTASRIKRADSILEWSDDETYLFYLEKEQNFMDFRHWRDLLGKLQFFFHHRTTPFDFFSIQPL